MADAFDELVFAGAPFDRAAELRPRHDILRRLLAEPATRVLDVGRHSVAAEREGETVSLRLRPPHPDDEGREALLLGRYAGRVVLAVRVEGDGLTPLRQVADLLPPDEASFAATAVALDNWHGTHPRCSRCGEPTVIAEAGWVRTCPADDSQHHPRTDPAVIMAVTDPDDRLLLARAPAWPQNRRSVLAGFVEPGERLEMAVARRGPGEVTGCVVHADRGSQFRARPYVTALHRAGLVGSMGRVASSADNAAMESFFALLQKNVLDRKRWRTRDELRIAIVTWIERKYHRRRRQARLGRLTPIEYETIMNPAVSLAA